jgi:hypothetical protein
LYKSTVPRKLKIKKKTNFSIKTVFEMVSVIQQIDSGHEDLIHGAEIDFYGLNLATCSSDNTIKVSE